MTGWEEQRVVREGSIVSIWWLKYCCSGPQLESGTDNNQYTTIRKDSQLKDITPYYVLWLRGICYAGLCVGGRDGRYRSSL